MVDLNPLSWVRSWALGRNPKISGRDDAETQAAYRRRYATGGSVDAALGLSTAWACIRLLSETSGTLPFPLYRRLGDDRAIAYDHPLYAILHDSPNAWQTAPEYWEGQVAQLCGWGNAYSEKKFMGSRLVALEPLRPDTGVSRNSDGDLIYTVNDRGRTERMPADKVFHLRGFGFGGDVGLSPIRYGWPSMSAALAAQDTARQFLEGGLQVAGFAKEGATAKSNADQRVELMGLFAEFMGSQASGKVMPLPHGWEFQQLTMNPEDAQLLETRGFDVEQVCRLFRVPPFMVGHSEKSTSWGTGLEQQKMGFLTFSLNPYLVRIEKAVNKQLLRPEERAAHYAEFVVEGLMRADSVGRAALYASGAQNGWVKRSEIRRKENLPPVEGSDVLTVQSNLVPLDQLGNGAASGEQQARSAVASWLGLDTLAAQLAALTQKNDQGGGAPPALPPPAGE